MSDQETLARSHEAVADEASGHGEQFSPVGTLFLMVLYIIAFAVAWGLVYFNDLLARR
jgi:hypothetical protein